MTHGNTVLLPGIAGIAGAAALLAVVIWLLPPTFWASENRALHAAALCAAFCAYGACGAAASAWSRRRGGTRAHRMLAAALPIILQATLVAVALSGEALADRRWHPEQPLRMPWRGVVAGLLFPGVAILGGALPFLGNPGRGQASR